MNAGQRRARATFWLLEAPDSLAEQSRRNPDGYGLGTYAQDGSPEVDKRPAAAYEDELFAREAREEESRTFVAHVRYASTGKVALENTHPFEQRGRLFAHNGAVLELEKLEARLGDYRDLVRGETDSERFFALVTRETDAHDGDVGAGIAAAAGWIAAELPLYSLNCVVSTPSDVWALRYPECHELLVLERASGGPTGARHLDAASPAGTIRVRSGALAGQPAVIFASEQMDEDRGWRALDPGELVHVDANLEVTSRIALGEPPAHQLRLEDLDPRAAASQRHPKRRDSHAPA
jgi:predicted glutamine amidotransferase